MSFFIQYLEKRFGKSTRLCASLAFSLQMILYMGIVLYAPALALEAITNISKVNAILIIGKWATELIIRESNDQIDPIDISRICMHVLFNHRRNESRSSYRCIPIIAHVCRDF